MPIAGEPTSIELGWAGDRMAIVMEAPLGDTDALVHVRSSFGDETLSWNAEHGLFGPTNARMDPFGHYRVSISIEAGGEELWAGKLWAYGIHDHHHHGHSH